jgi:peptidoglycan/LPS O-acetylase OafA/YrhL
MNPEKSVRIEALDGLRGWAVALVFLVHFCGTYAAARRGLNFDMVTNPLALAPADVLLYWLFYSHHGVQLFFAISGFVITRSFAASRTLPDYLTFIGFRVLRIYPAFLAALALALALATHVNGMPPIRLVTVAQNLLFLNGVFALGIPGYDYVTWSLFYEFAFYLVFPLLYLLAVRGGTNARRVAPVLWIGFIVALVLASFNEWLLFLPFFCGAWAGLQSDATRDRIAARLPDAALVGAYLLITTVAAFLVPLPRFGSEGLTWPLAAPVYVFALSVVGTLIIIRVSHSAGFLYKLLTSAPMQALGRVSYSFFLVHALVIAAAFAWTPGSTAGSLAMAALMAIVCFTVAYALASLLYTLAEKPYYRIRRYASRAAQARRDRRAAALLR